MRRRIDTHRRTGLGAAAGLATALLASGALAGCLGPSDNMPDPKSVAVYDVANDEFRKGELRAALAKVRESLDLDSHNAEAAHLGALIYLGFCERAEGSSDCRYDDAVKLAEKAVEYGPDLREAKNTLGVALIHQKKFDDAVRVLKPLTEDILYGSPQVSWANLGWAYLEQGSYDLAIDALRRSVAAQPVFCVGNYRLGDAYERKGDLRAASAAYTRAVETDRPHCSKIQEAWEGRGRVEKRLGNVDGARDDLERCVKLSPMSPSAKRCSGLLSGLPARSEEPRVGSLTEK